MLPYFKRSENNENGADAFHGAGGPLSVSNIRSLHPLSHDYLQTCVNFGIERVADINTPPQAGVGYVPATQQRGRRHSTGRAYLRPAMRRRNLRVLTHAHIRRVLFDGKRATGVEYMRRGRTERAEAARAVIVCAGTYASPQLLMLSGVGPAEHLREFDIRVVHDLPGVGENLQDHPGLAQTCFASVPTYNTLMGPVGAVLYGAQWLLAGSGPAASPHAQVTAFLRVATGARAAPTCNTCSHPPATICRRTGRSCLIGRRSRASSTCSGPHSRGRVGLRSADPLAHSTIQPNLFADERDLELLLAGAKLQRKLFQTDPLARSIAGDYRPSSDVQTDDEWRAYLRENSLSGYHPVGTCKMGRATTWRWSITACACAGIESLLVADASIMPTIVSGNPLATCVMIGEKVAEMIRAVSLRAPYAPARRSRRPPSS